MHLVFKSQVFAAVLLFLASLISPCVAQDTATQEWRRYTANDEEFSVLLPVAPAMSTTSISLGPDTKRRQRVLAAYADGVVYVVFTYENKSIAIEDLIGNVSLQESAQIKPVSVSGITGKTYKHEDADRVREVQFFATKKNLYAFQAWGSKLGNPGTAIPKFLSSISFEKNPAGIKVEDGPGDEPRSSGVAPVDNSGVAQGPSLAMGQMSGADVLAPREATLRAKVVTKPEPRYTERARMNQVTGTVVLRGVFSSSGTLTNISVVKGLSDGLTERAMLAAKQIRFIPAIKDGRFVSTWLQLEYNFNLY